MELTRADYDTLIEALEAWENKDASADILDTILTPMLTRGLGGMPPEMRAEREYQKSRQMEEKAIRKERSVLLRAKLIQIRDAVKKEL